MFEKLDDFQSSDMPARKLPFWKLAGPGAVLVGLSIGAGEIIIWPGIVAEFGGAMIWAAVVGVFIQFWVNLEVGRWTIATGETVFTGFSRAWRGFAPLMILLAILGNLAPGWAMGSGLSLKALLVGPEFGPATSDSALAGLLGTNTFWTAVSFAGVALVLFGPKIVYQSVERTIELLLVVITIGLIVVAIAVGTADTWKQLGQGIANITTLHWDDSIPLKRLFGAVVFAGAGGVSNLFYTFYLRDKNVGMGARLPAMVNPLRGRQETIPATGHRYPDNPENAGRFRSWFSFIRRDQLVFFFGLNLVTMLLFMFGALAVLRPAGIVPKPNSLIYDQAVILGQVWGGTGRTLFLLIGMATLFSTQLVIVDGIARTLSDIIYTNFKGARKRDLSWWYLLVASLWMLIGCGFTAFMEWSGVTNLGFLLSSALMGGFAMAVYVPLLLWINLRYLPQSAKPGRASIAFVSFASLVYIGFAIAYLGWEFASP